MPSHWTDKLISEAGLPPGRQRVAVVKASVWNDMVRFAREYDLVRDWLLAEEKGPPPDFPQPFVLEAVTVLEMERRDVSPLIDPRTGRRRVMDPSGSV